MQNFIPQARAHSLPDENPLDENPLPDVTLCPPAPARLLPDVNPLPDGSPLLQVAQLPEVTLHPDVNLHSDMSTLPDVSMLPDVNLHPDVDSEYSTSSLPSCQVISTETPPRVCGAHLGPPYMKNTSHSQNDQNTLGSIKCK